MATRMQEKLLLEKEYLPIPSSVEAKDFIRSIGIDMSMYRAYYFKVCSICGSYIFFAANVI